MAVVLRTLLVFISALSPVISTPLYTSSFSNSGNARNIRHLPCVSLRSGKTGVCMFALDCVKANGTHLGTCLDRFYFGSCCKIDNEFYVHPQDNTIEESSSFITTIKPIESNDIPDIIKINNSILEKPILTTKKPTVETKTTTTTTQTSIRLSTFQTISDDGSSTSFVTGSPTTNSRPLTTQKPSTTLEIQRKPITTTQFVKPTSLPLTTERILPATRFPPRNATTTTAAPTSVTIITSISDSSSTSTRKPTTTGTKKPVNSANTRPSSTTLITKPIVTTTQKPLEEVATIVTATTTTTTTAAPTKQPISSTSSATLSTLSKKPSKPRPSSTEIPRPSTSTTKPRPSSKPSKSPGSTSSKPTKISAKPSTISQKPAGKPRPSNKPTKYPKPPKPVTPFTTTTFETTTTTSTTTPTVLPPSSSTTPTTAGTTQAIPTTVNITSTTLGNDIPPIKLAATTENSVSSVETLTQSFVTWSSNSDELVTSTTAPPTTSITSTIQEHEETTETEWSPITTPDGWIMIQNLSTKQPDNDNDTTTTTEIPTTQSPSTSVEILSSTTESIPTEKVPTIIPTTNRPASASPAFDHFNMSDYKQVCGRRLFPESRIVGGSRSSFGKWPWQISLRQWRNSVHLHKCGAALLNENWAITAAHCVENVPPSELLLRIGEYDLANEDEPYGFQERRVQMVASHPSFDPRTFEYDLALLRFYEPLAPFQPNYLPICVPDDDEGYVGQTAYVTGWGRLYEDGPLPSVLQEVSVPIINNSDCEGMYRAAGYIEHIPKIFICAGWKKGGFDSCEGDSGGPLVIRRPRDNRWILAGVISWGIGCAMPFQPGVYTRISEFKEWINQILQF